MVVRMRHTRAHTANRRSHHALKTKNLVPCAKCETLKEQHTMCRNCGEYKGRIVKQSLTKVEKKAKTVEKKTQAKEAKKTAPKKAKKTVSKKTK
jgi:large subunit ribosomal protein L32